MAEVKFAKGTEEWELFRDYWNLCQSVWKIENNDDYWQDVVDLTDKFYKKYQSRFARELALALVCELERKSKENKIGSSLNPAAGTRK